MSFQPLFGYVVGNVYDLAGIERIGDVSSNARFREMSRDLYLHQFSILRK